MTHQVPSRIVAGMLALCLAACATSEAPRPAAASTAAAAAPVSTTPPTAVRPEFPGFTMVIRKGEELYCQKRNPTGSRARVVEACYTRDQMRKMAESSDEYFKQAGAASSHDSLRTDSPR